MRSTKPEAQDKSESTEFTARSKPVSLGAEAKIPGGQPKGKGQSLICEGKSTGGKCGS